VPSALALVGAPGGVIHFLVVSPDGPGSFAFDQRLPVAVLTAGTTNYLNQQCLPSRFQPAEGSGPACGACEVFLWWPPCVPGERGCGFGFYSHVFSADRLWAQLAGILVVFVWN